MLHNFVLYALEQKIKWPLAVWYSDPACRISLCRISLCRINLCKTSLCRINLWRMCRINLCRMCRITIFMSLICEFLSREFPLLLPFVWRYSPLLPEPPLLLLPERRLGFFCRSIFGGTFGRLTGASEPLDRGGEIRFGGWDWDLKQDFNLFTLGYHSSTLYEF